jgi:hypothetical protein
MMMINQDRNRDTPRWCQGVSARSSDWDPVGGLHQGQRQQAPHQQAGQMTATCNDHRQSRKPVQKRSRPQMTPPTAVVYFNAIETDQQVQAVA